MSQMDSQICVTLCTHNPNETILKRVLTALSKQSFRKDLWHLRLVDNASSINFSHCLQEFTSKIDIRLTREERAGILWARMRAFTESKSEIYVILDDDTIPEEGYLENVYKHFQRYSNHGAIGGRNSGDFESKPPFWTVDLLPYLAVSDRGDEIIYSDGDKWGLWEPAGAGMGIRLQVVTEFLKICSLSTINDRMNRTNKILIGGEDTLLARCSYRLSLKCAYTPKLHLRHVIPKARLKFGYLRSLMYGLGYSCYYTDLSLGARIRKISVKELRSSFWYLIKTRGLTGYLHWNNEKGYYDAIQANRSHD